MPMFSGFPPQVSYVEHRFLGATRSESLVIDSSGIRGGPERDRSAAG